MSSIQCHVFIEIPGCWPGWSLAVMSVSLADAREYMRVYNKGGKLSYSVVGGGSVKADCGAVTAKAQDILAAALEVTK